MGSNPAFDLRAAYIEFYPQGSQLWLIYKVWTCFWTLANQGVVSSFQVQSDHFEEFFAPELDKHGYQALFKRKTAEVGCWTFALLL